jgi:hypothetical protein
MTNTKIQVERRKHQRFQVQNGAFVVLTPPGTKVGRIVDISIGGLAFHYVGKQESSRESTQLSIFSGDCSFYLYRVPCATVSDLRAYAGGVAPLSIRRHSVQFGELTRDQVSRLEHFIRHYSTDEEGLRANYTSKCQRTDIKSSTVIPVL